MMKRIVAIISILSALYLGGCRGSTDEVGIKDLYDMTPPKTAPKRHWKNKSLVIVYDTSGSMDAKLDGTRKITAAGTALEKILNQYKKHDDKNKNIQAGLLYLDGCTVKQAVTLDSFDHAKLSGQVKAMRAGGDTPLGIAIAYAERMLDRHATGRKYILLLTDGKNTSMCSRAPEQVFKKLIETNKKYDDSETKLFVVAYDTDKRNFRKLEELGAKVYGAKDNAELEKALQDHTNILLEKIE